MFAHFVNSHGPHWFGKLPVWEPCYKILKYWCWNRLTFTACNCGRTYNISNGNRIWISVDSVVDDLFFVDNDVDNRNDAQRRTGDDVLHGGSGPLAVARSRRDDFRFRKYFWSGYFCKVDIYWVQCFAHWIARLSSQIRYPFFWKNSKIIFLIIKS